jgi:hypothetical protein
MEPCSLHPFDLTTVQTYVHQLAANELATPASANAITAGLAHDLATKHPTFAHYGLGLTPIEARIDRGVGMLLRPPSRLFGDAGLDQTLSRSLPIRVDLAGGMMGGAFIPARLIPDLQRLIDRRTERFLKRMAEAEMDNVAALGLLIEACQYAIDYDLGIYEAVNVILPDAPESWPPGAKVIGADRKRLDRDLRKRLEEAAKPPKKPGLMARLFAKRAVQTTPNGHIEGADGLAEPWDDRQR